MSSISHAPVAGARDPFWQHLVLVVVVSTAFESLFIYHGLNRFDESWPLYAAMRLHEGGTLYDDVFFLFPPGHVLPAWLAYTLDAPGLALSRIFYATFTVSLTAVFYLLGRRLMTPNFALLGALMMALASPRGHLWQLLFGYRYFLFSALALLAFSNRQRTGSPIWMFAAGVAIGIGVFFRLSPPFAVSCGIAIAVVALGGSWRDWLRDLSLCTAGAMLVLAPVLAYLQWSVGLDVVFREVMVRLMGLQSAQSVSLPPWTWPTDWSRVSIYKTFVAFEFRFFPVLIAGYLGTLFVLWWRDRRAQRPFGHALLLAIAVAASIYFLRTLGRSDEPHLDSALPPMVLLMAYGTYMLSKRIGGAAAPRASVERLLCAATLGLWIFLPGTDLYVTKLERGIHPVESTREGITIPAGGKAVEIDRIVNTIKQRTQPGDIVLNLSESPIFHLLSGRPGPGFLDVIMPATFLDAAEERAFVERVAADPPAVVIWPERPFDRMPSRGITATAPQLAAWVKAHYERIPRRQRRWALMFPRHPRATHAGGSPR